MKAKNTTASFVSLGLNAFSSLHGLYTTSKIADAQRASAALQYEYNQREIDRAFDYNLENMLRDYATENLNATKEAEVLLDQVNLNFGNKANVESESIVNDTVKEIEQKIHETSKDILSVQAAGFYELANLKASQEYNISKNLIDVNTGIATQEMVYANKYKQELANSFASAINLYKSTSGTEEVIINEPDSTEQYKEQTNEREYKWNRYTGLGFTV